jgi:DNA-binding NtrC family response regulator
MADTGEHGLRQSGEFKGEIDLLITDFQMAGMSGIDLATAMTANRPKLKVLMMSGFPEGMLVLNEGWHFLPKPFIASQMRTLVCGSCHHGLRGISDSRHRARDSDETRPA